MANVIVNGTPHTGATAGLWGDLLDVVDREVASSGKIVAAVRFDGVDEPGFREPAVLIRPLDTDLIVEVDTEAPAALLGRMLDEGTASLPALEASARDLANGFRGPSGDRGGAGPRPARRIADEPGGLLAASASAAGYAARRADAGWPEGRARAHHARPGARATARSPGRGRLDHRRRHPGIRGRGLHPAAARVFDALARNATAAC